MQKSTLLNKLRAAISEEEYRNLSENADGTGMRYYQESGLMGSNITFRWELHGNKLKLQEIEEDSKDSDSGLTACYTITNHTLYTIDLWEENSGVDPELTLFLKDT